MTGGKKSFFLPDALYEYVLKVSLRETAVQRELREQTQRYPNARMQSGPDQVQLLQLLVRLIGARRTLEIGVFTGYSALGVALALPPEGRLIACDVDEASTVVARAFWERAGVAHKIDLRLAPAVQTLDALLDGGAAASFDFAYIDADKTGYDAYYERVLSLLRRGGLAAIDNVFWNGAVADPDADDADTVALRALNEKIGRDERVDASMIPIGDGLTLVRKR